MTDLLYELLTTDLTSPAAELFQRTLAEAEQEIMRSLAGATAPTSVPSPSLGAPVVAREPTTSPPNAGGRDLSEA